jgi:hypothetical protein
VFLSYFNLLSKISQFNYLVNILYIKVIDKGDTPIISIKYYKNPVVLEFLFFAELILAVKAAGIQPPPDFNIMQ